MKKLLALTLAALLLAAVLTGCASAPAEPPAADSQPTQTEQPAAEEPAAEQPAAEEEPVAEEPALADGVYTADFDTDSSMFHANEACDGKGTLTVKDGEMTIHVSLVSKTILNLFPGLAEDAQKDGAVLLQPTTDTVTYSDLIPSLTSRSSARRASGTTTRFPFRTPSRRKMRAKPRRIWGLPTAHIPQRLPSPAAPANPTLLLP